MKAIKTAVESVWPVAPLAFGARGHRVNIPTAPAKTGGQRAEGLGDGLAP